MSTSTEGREAVTVRVVPVEPTEAMLDAYWQQTGESMEMRDRTHDRFRRYWSSVLAAAPSPAVPAPAGEAVRETAQDRLERGVASVDYAAGYEEGFHRGKEEAATPAPDADGLREADFLRQLRQANITRNAEYRAKTNGEALPLLFRTTEFAGEVGELLNVVKKIERERLGWGGKRATREMLLEEFGGVVATLDLLAMELDVDLAAATLAEFNAVTDRLSLTTKLTAALAQPAESASPVIGNGACLSQTVDGDTQAESAGGKAVAGGVDVVALLRRYAEKPDDFDPLEFLCGLAADFIEALQREKEALARKVDELIDNSMGLLGNEMRAIEAAQRAEAALASAEKRADETGELATAVLSADYALTDGDRYSVSMASTNRMVDLARHVNAARAARSADHG